MTTIRIPSNNYLAYGVYLDTPYCVEGKTRISARHRAMEKMKSIKRVKHVIREVFEESLERIGRGK